MDDHTLTLLNTVANVGSIVVLIVTCWFVIHVLKPCLENIDDTLTDLRDDMRAIRGVLILAPIPEMSDNLATVARIATGEMEAVDCDDQETNP